MAVIDEETFKAAQERARKNWERAKRNRKRKYLLTGHIKCGDCGMAVNGIARSVRNGKETYYRCGSHIRKYSNCAHRYRYVRTKLIDGPVWDWIVWLLSDDHNLKTGLRELVENRKNELNPKREKHESTKELIIDADNKVNRLVSELSKYDEVVLSAIREKIKTVSKNRESLENESSRLETELSQLVISIDMENQTLKLAARVREKLPGAAYEDKKRFLDLLDVNIALYYGYEKDTHIEINCQIPTPSTQFPHNQDSDENIFIVSHTSRS